MEHYYQQWNKPYPQQPEEFVRERIIGEIPIVLPEPPKKSKDILFHDLPRKEQYWRPLITLTDKEIQSLGSDERKALLTKEYERRINGVFFYNNGGIEYISGIHYFYLSYWNIAGVGLPQFRDADRDFFYAWDKVCEDEECYGLAYFTNRRSGKTEKAINILYEFTSRTKEIQSGIQSQTNRDAKRVFERLVFGWKKMRYFWKPTDSGEKNPKQALRFEEPSTRNTKGLVKQYKEVLNSLVDYAASNETSYDGYKIHRYYCDEFGKFTDGDAYARWKVVKPTLRDDYKIIGKAIFTTTVEDLEKGGGQKAFEIYNDSDYNVRGADDRTTSGLYRLFKPSYYGYIVNKYGYSEIEVAKKKLLAERQGLEGEDLAQLTRKYPFTVKEAFQSSLSSNTFPVFKIIQQKDYNTTNNIIPRKFNLIWENRDEYKVRLVDDPKGVFEATWLPTEEMTNRFEMVNDLPKPLNTSLGGFGVDPFDHRTTVDNKQSKGACLGFRNYDPMNPFQSNTFFFKYLHRPPKETIFYDDMTKIFVYFGMEALIENQKAGLINYMLDNGFKHYIKRTQQGDYTKSTSRNWVLGVSTSGEMIRDAMVNNLVEYIYDFVGKITPDNQRKKFGIDEDKIREDFYGNCAFEDLLTDWERFTIDKWTDYDLTVASMLARLNVTPVRKKKILEEEINLEIGAFFKKHKL